jgi:hypothetical protein
VEPIFDRAGRTVGWRKRDVVYGMDGRARAFVSARALYTLDGAFLGRFEDDLYRDRAGRIVAFEREATGGPLLPVPETPPVAPPPELRPPVPRFEPPPPAPMRSMAWSQSTWDEVLGQPAARPAPRDASAVNR